MVSSYLSTLHQERALTLYKWVPTCKTNYSARVSRVGPSESWEICEGQPTTRSVIVHLHNAADHNQIWASCRRGASRLKSVTRSQCQPRPLPPLPRSMNLWQPTTHCDSSLPSQTLTEEWSRCTNNHSQPSNTTSMSPRTPVHWPATCDLRPGLWEDKTASMPSLHPDGHAPL